MRVSGRQFRGGGRGGAGGRFKRSLNLRVKGFGFGMALVCLRGGFNVALPGGPQKLAEPSPWKVGGP